MVQEKVDKMGITDLQFSDWSYALCNNFEKDNSLSNLGTDLRFFHTYYKQCSDYSDNADGGALEDLTSLWKPGLLKVFISLSIKMQV